MAQTRTEARLPRLVAPKTIAREMIALGIIALSGCSPYVYKPEITGFSTGVTALVSSYQTGEQTIDTNMELQRQSAESRNRTRLDLSPGCDQRDLRANTTTLPDCVIVTFGARAAPPLTDLQQTLTNAAPAFNGLKSYAAALIAVTNAADDATLTQAAQGLTSAANDLASAVTKVDPSAVAASALVTPVGNLLGQGITAYLDSRRYTILRDTVPAVDPAVKILGNTVEKTLAVIRRAELAKMLADTKESAAPLQAASVGQLSQSDYKTKLASLEARLAAYNQVRSVVPSDSVSAMVKAHGQLATALKDNAGQQAAILATVQSFVDSAQKVRAAAAAAAAANAAPAAKK